VYAVDLTGFDGLPETQLYPVFAPVLTPCQLNLSKQRQAAHTHSLAVETKHDVKMEFRPHALHLLQRQTVHIK
jgi:hypothetical protein